MADDLVLTGEEWVVAAARIHRPPTSDDVTITLDGRRLDSKEKVLAWLAEIDVDRAVGRPVAANRRNGLDILGDGRVPGRRDALSGRLGGRADAKGDYQAERKLFH